MIGMNRGFHFGIFVLLLGSSQASESSNPECEDLDALQKKAISTVENIATADAHVKCNTNKNCTGLICSGKLQGKDFQGTAVLEGCNEPVRMLIHVNGKQMYVKDGFERRIMKKPIPIYVAVNLEKKNNIVFMTLKMKVCLLTKLCKYINLVKEQKIRVHCNDSETTMHPSLLPPAEHEHFKPKGKGGERGLVLPDSRNPECKGLKNTNDQLQRHFKNIRHFYPDAKMNCKPANNCSELRCSGVANDDPFNATMIIDYCSHSVKLWLKVDSQKKTHINHGFADGDTYPIVEPLLKFRVRMKRVKNIILLSVSIPVLTQDLYLVKNMSITVDPSHCPGYQDWNTVDFSANKSHSKSLSPGAIAGVVVAVIVFFVLLIAVIVWIVHGKRQRISRYNDLAMTDDSDPLVFDSNPVA